MRLTKVFAKAELDNVTSAKYKHQQWFGLDVQGSAFVHNFNSIFSIGHLCWAGQSMNSQPSQIQRCVKWYKDNGQQELNLQKQIKVA